MDVIFSVILPRGILSDGLINRQRKTPVDLWNGGHHYAISWQAEFQAVDEEIIKNCLPECSYFESGMKSFSSHQRNERLQRRVDGAELV